MRVSYSEETDVLYIAFSSDQPQRAATYIEKENGDILRVDAMTGTVLGVTIQLFRYRLRKGEKIEVPEVGVISFNQIMVALMESRLVKTH